MSLLPLRHPHTQKIKVSSLILHMSWWCMVILPFLFLYSSIFSLPSPPQIKKRKKKTSFVLFFLLSPLFHLPSVAQTPALPRVMDNPTQATPTCTHLQINTITWAIIHLLVLSLISSTGAHRSSKHTHHLTCDNPYQATFVCTPDQRHFTWEDPPPPSPHSPPTIFHVN